MNCLILIPWLKSDQKYPVPGYIIFPMGIGYISAALKKMDGIKVVSCDLNHVNGDRKDFIRDIIKKEKIDVLLSGGVCAIYSSLNEIFETAKKAAPRLITVTGGPIITGDAEAAMEALEFADYGIIGEGDETAPELIMALAEGRDPATVPGLIFRKGGALLTTANRKAPADISVLPWCDFDGFDFKTFLGQELALLPSTSLLPFEKISLPLLSARSCVNRCTFCFHKKGDTYRRRDLDDMFHELDNLLEKYDITNFHMVDDMLGSPLARLKDFCGRIKKYGRPWMASLRVVDMNAEAAKALKDAGCRAVCLGLESASDRILASMKKGITVQQIENALETAQEAGLVAFGSFIFCDPEETPESCHQTLEWFLAHPQYNISFLPLQYYPGSEIYWKAVSMGKITDRVEYLQNSNKAGAFLLNCTSMSDEEYFHIINVKLPEYQRRRYLLLPELEDVSVCLEKGRTSILGRCSHCKKELRFNKVSFVASHDPLVCQHCATLHSTSFPYRKFSIEANLKYLLNRYGKIAVWGIGNQVRSFIDPEWLSHPDIVLVDTLRSDPFGDKELLRPESLKDSGVQAAVIPQDYRARNGTFPAREIRRLASELGVKDFVTYEDLFYADLKEDGL